MTSSPSNAPFWCVRLRAEDPVRAECALAEAFAAGAAGAEESVEKGGVTFAVYAPGASIEAVRAAVAIPGVALLSAAPVPSQDWSEAWKRDLVPIVVSPRLALRPSFAAFDPLPGQRVLVVDPGQAFGTGGHESTRLALEAVDAWADALGPEDALLDVGTGTGVLALAALALGCGRAVGLDLDPLATAAARRNAADNALGDRLALFTGGVDALSAPGRFDFVVANLLWSELRPLLPGLLRQLAPDGRIGFSGLIEAQRPALEAELGSVLRRERVLRREDASGTVWVGVLMRRASDPAASADR